MKIFVTGGAGFIGSHLNDALLQKGHDVSVIDNFVLGTMDNVKHNLSNNSFKLYREDILNLNKLEDIFETEKFDVVFHLAANSDIQKSIEAPSVDYELTFQTTFNVLLCMKKFQVNKILFSSSSAIYGESSAVLREDSGPLFPISHYGAAKLASEAFISSFCENYGVKAWIFRFPNVVGERATHGVIQDFVRRLRSNPEILNVLGDGNQNKPYLYVKDLVDAMLFCWEQSNDKINYFNIGVDTRTRVKTIADIVIRNMGLNPRINFTGGDRGWVGDVPEFTYDLAKLKRLGWMPRHTSDEAVELAVRAMLLEAGIRPAV